ncbi:MAG: hypothetical protein HDR09_06700 [Lachnospiraceae bacterium]|nr:hypothetical protein [Lachnospiraceae bacterium]
MREQTGRKLMAGILAAVMMITSLPETVYAAEQAGRTEQDNSVWAEDGNNVDEKIEVETSDEKNDEDESKVDIPNDEINKDDVNEDEMSDQDNVSREENEAEMPDNDGDREEMDEESPDDVAGEEDLEVEDENDLPEEDVPVLYVDSRIVSAGIANNGLNNIRIDINAHPYTTYQNKSKGEYAYTDQGCAWFAAARVNQLTGIDCIIHSGSSWWTSAYQGYGFSKGTSLRSDKKALACYQGHVSVVEAVNGNVVTISECGNLSYPSNGYCVIREVSKNELESKEFLGYIYLPADMTDHNPKGTLDSVTGGAGSITVRGWAFDYDAPDKTLEIHVYIGDPPNASGYRIFADKWRPDVGNAYSGAGNYHGFQETITTERTGVQNVYVYAINAEDTEGDPHSLIGQGTVAITDRVKGSYMDTGYEQTIPDGYYHIVSSFGDKWWLTISESSMADGGNVKVADYSGKDFESDEQLFYLKFIDDGDGRGFYKITNKLSGKCLDVERASEYMLDENNNPTNVQQWEDNGSSAQRWAIREVDGGEKGALYTFKARVSGFCLDWFGGEEYFIDGSGNVSMYYDNKTSAQLWRLVPYVPPKMDPPTASIPSGSVVAGGTRIFLNGGGADHIYFTWDGSDPRTSPNRYGYYTGFDRSGIAVFSYWETMTIKAYAVKEGYQDSDVVEFTYIVAENMESKLAPPTASLPSGTEVEAGTAVSLLSGTDGAAIYYTLDGTNPSRESFHYSKPFIIEKDTLITACVVKDGYEDSDPAVFTYTVKSQDDYGKGDVLDEDIPQGNVENIPQGLWMSAVSSQIYTGKAIKPQVRVYDHTTLLTEKKDYIISYKNNVKANIVSGGNVPTVTVTGKGNYTGKEVQTFVISPKSLADVDIMADDITLQYNGKVQKPLPFVTWNGKKLTKNKDYTVSYPNEESDGVANPTAYIKSGTYTVLIKGMGNYTGEKTINLTITQSKSASTMTVAKIADHTYTGTEVRPVPVVKSGKVVLTEGEDYEVSYQNNIKVGTATVMITGKGSYAGVKKVTFKIVPRASLNKARAELEFDSPLVYNGRVVRPDRCWLTVSEKNADGRTVTVTLTEGADYEVSYRNDNKAGTATVIFQGVNGYSGTLKKTYKIAPYDIGKDEADLTEEAQKIRIELADSYAYVKGGCKPEPVVTYQGKVLTKGTDYTLSYRNNNGLNDGSNPKKQSVVIVKGKGCFKGTREKTYRITSKEIGRLTMTAADMVWQNKGNIYKTKVAIKDENGMALSAGKDYDSAFTYEYNNDTVLADGTLRYAGERVTAQDIIPAGTVIRVTAAAKGSNYSGTVACVYRITKADIGKAVVTIPTQTYTGRAITPENEIRIKLNGQILPAENYKITGYGNNINKGTATVTISGINDCGGTKTAKFKIKGKGLLWWWR